MSHLPKKIEICVDMTQERLIENLVTDIVLGLVDREEVLQELARTHPKLAQRVRSTLHPEVEQ